MIKIERVIRKIFILTTLCLSLGVGANTATDPNLNPATSFNYMPNMINNLPNYGGANNLPNYGGANNLPNYGGANNLPNYGGANNWQSYNNNANMMQMMGGANMTYMPYNNMMPYMPNNNWMPSGANSNWGSFGAYNNMMPMMGVNGAMPYTNYNSMGMNQANINTELSLNQAPAAPALTSAWGSLDANAAWGLGGDLSPWTQQAQSDDLSSQDPADVIAQLMSGEHAAIYQKIIADAYEKGFAEAMVQGGAGGICTPTPTELPEFNLESE